MSVAPDELAVICEHLERYRAVTLQTLDLVPDEKLFWRPENNLRSFSEQFAHIAQTGEFYARGLFQGEWNFETLQPPRPPLDRLGLRARLSGERAATVTQISALDVARLDQVVLVPGVPVQWPLRSWLWYVVEHEVHHKAQLALYLREIGITPPFFAYALPPGVRPDIG